MPAPEYMGLTCMVEILYNKDVNAYFWSATRKVESDTVDLGITRILFLKEDRIMRSSSKLSGAYSVRCIKE